MIDRELPTRRMRAMFLLLPLLAGCFDQQAKDEQYQKDKSWNEPCSDVSTLLATTAGSPSDQRCPNKRHKTRVQIATGPSREEFGALVFCECVR